MHIKSLLEGFGKIYDEAKGTEKLNEVSDGTRQLTKALFDAVHSLQNKGERNIKAYEYALQDVIAKHFPDSLWWQVTDCDIFWSLFNDKDPEKTVIEIVKGIKPEFKEETIRVESALEESKQLTEGASNFWTMKNFPLLVFDDYNSVYDRVYDMTKEEIGDRIEDEEDEWEYIPNSDEFEQNWEKYFDYCTLTDEEQVGLQEDIDEFNRNIKAMRYEKEEEDEGFYPDVKVEIRPGYYEAAQLFVDNEKDLADWQYEQINSFFKEIKNKYGLTEFKKAWQASNGEAGYEKVNEGIEDDDDDDISDEEYYAELERHIASIPSYDLKKLKDEYREFKGSTYEDDKRVEKALRVELIKRKALTEALLDERNLTKAERHNRNAERIFASKKAQDKKYTDFLKRKGYTDEQIKKLSDADALSKEIADKFTPKGKQPSEILGQILGESAGQDVTEYQKWVDYDMKKYHRISDDTMNKIKKAGLSVVKDQYGDYEVIAYRPIKESFSVIDVETGDKFGNFSDSEKATLKARQYKNLGLGNNLVIINNETKETFALQKDGTLKALERQIAKRQSQYNNAALESLKSALGKDYRSIKLEDDDSDEGGIAFAGETLGDFLDEVGDKFKTVKELNRALKSCGIKPLKESRGNYGHKPPFWYFTAHGVQKGSIPNDVIVLASVDGKNEKGTEGTFVALDGVLTADELKKFDMKELAPKVVADDIKKKIAQQLKGIAFYDKMDESTKFDGIIKFTYTTTSRGGKVGYTTEQDLNNMLNRGSEYFWFTDDIADIDTRGIPEVKSGWTCHIDNVDKFYGNNEITKKFAKTEKLIQKPKHITNEAVGDEIKVYMNTWANYNENGADLSAYGINSIADGWLTVDEAIEFAEEHAEDEPFINDVENAPYEVSEYDNAMTVLNDFKELEDSDADMDVVYAIIEANDTDIKEAIEIAENGDYYFYAGVDNDTDLAHAVIDEIGGLGDALGDRVNDYIDKEAMRRDYEYDVRNMMYDDAESAYEDEDGITEEAFNELPETTEIPLDEVVLDTENYDEDEVRDGIIDRLDDIASDTVGFDRSSNIEVKDFHYEIVGEGDNKTVEVSDIRWRALSDFIEDKDTFIENWIDEHLDGYLDAIIDDDIALAQQGEVDLSDYFDYERFGRDLRFDGYVYTDKGAILVL